MPHAQPRLPHWLAGKWGRLRSALMCGVAVGRRPKKEGDGGEAAAVGKAAAEKRPLDSHKAPGLSPGSWSKRCTPSALQAVKQQRQRCRCHKCCKLATRCRCRQCSPFPHSLLATPLPLPAVAAKCLSVKASGKRCHFHLVLLHFVSGPRWMAATEGTKGAQWELSGNIQTISQQFKFCFCLSNTSIRAT